MLAVLTGALKELRSALQERGSDLLIATGTWEDTVTRVAKQYGCKSVVVQREVEHT